MAECYNKAGERLIILGIREAYIQPFDAPNWLDLRVGFFLSICQPDPNDDTITGLTDAIVNGGDGLYTQDRYWIGLKSDDPLWPRSPGVVFMGYSNSQQHGLGHGGQEFRGDSVLSGSDTGIGAGVNYWWPHNSFNTAWSAIVTDSAPIRSGSATGSQQHFAQVVGGAGAAGYATLFAIRLTRLNIASKLVTMQYKIGTAGAFSSDILFSSTPTTDLIQSNLLTFPTSVQTRGPIQLSKMPDALYFYWPFTLSRLRIHSIGVMKFK